MFHCPQNTGYAIGRLEKIFMQAAREAGYEEDRIFWSFSRVNDERSQQVTECDYRCPSPKFKEFLFNKKIETVLAFDLNYPSPVLGILRASGVKTVISYWGAAISSFNRGLRLALKRCEWLLRRNKPDYFIFESEAMRATATKGRGVPKKRTIVIPLGVDTVKFTPSKTLVDTYAHQTFRIPVSRKIIFYSGHMEERKGIKTIINSAIELIDHKKQDDIHFLLCGNCGDEALPYLKMLESRRAREHITFGGYRDDIAELMRSSYMGVIASTGWDSFTMSSVEMMASGLPLIVSNLQGLSETIEDGVNGFYVEPGSYLDLSIKIEYLKSNPEKAIQFSLASRKRAEHLFSIEQQIREIAGVLKKMSAYN